MANKTLRTLATAASALSLSMILMSACGDDAADTAETTGPTTGATASSTGAGGNDPGICLLNNCTDDQHCKACEDGRNTCKLDENRCVACDPVTGQGCAAGEKCSSFGLCIPEGTPDCSLDAGKAVLVKDGVTGYKCNGNADCKACSPQHQVCNTTTGECQACTSTNTQHCLQSDICLDGKCSPKCPQSCDKHTDCTFCGGPGNEAKACNKHKCAQCAPDSNPNDNIDDGYPCAAGQECINGVCVPPCGVPGPVQGRCTVDAEGMGVNEDCQFCGAGTQSEGEWTCKVPLGGAATGNCQPPADGCTDLGGLTLPAPYSDFTQLCDNDDGCSNISVDYNIGGLVKNLVGGNELNLGFTTLEIHDATVKYGMNECAEINLAGNDCGFCVPCDEDSDCKPIAILPIVQDLFGNDPLATIAGAILIDLLWGALGSDGVAALHFWCQPLIQGYGACIPCANPTSSCGTGQGGPGSGNCDHDVDEEGGPLDPSCGECEAAVCDQDPYCCDPEGAWDDICVAQVNQYCGGTACVHDECMVGASLDPSCGSCEATVCELDDFCCNEFWDDVCVCIAQDECGANCGADCG